MSDHLQKDRDLNAMMHLHQIGMVCVRDGDMGKVLGDILDCAIEISGAILGTIQLVDKSSGLLRTLSRHGFSGKWCRSWDAHAYGSWDAGMRRGERLIVEDTEQSDTIFGTERIDMLRSAGVRAVQSTGLMARSGQFLGVLSTHYGTARRPDAHDLRHLDLLARQMTDIIEHDEARQAMYDSQSSLSLALEAGQAGTWHFHPVTGEFIAGEAALKLLGFIPGTAVTRKMALASVHPDDLPRVAKDLRHLSKSGEPMALDLRFRCADGAEKWLHCRAIQPTSPSRGMFGHIQDISARKQSERLLAEREAFARQQMLEIETIYAAAPVGLAVLDRELRFIRVNNMLAEINGFAVADHIGKPIREILPLLADKVELVIRRILETGEALVGLELSGETRSQPGVVRTWVVQWIPLYGGLDEIVGLNLVVEEITERKRAEALAALLSAIVTSTSEAIIAKGTDGRIMTWNGGAEAMFGYTAEEMIGRSINCLLPADREGEEDAILAQINQGKHIRNLETVRVGKRGQTLDVSLAISPILDKKGRVVGSSKIIHDISDKKRAIQREHMLLREVNHRSKNMLALVQSIAQLSAAGNPKDFVERFAQRIQGLAASQDVLVKSGWTNVTFETLVKCQLTHFVDLMGRRIQLLGPALKVGASAAQALGMTLHELATNATKYGALSNDTGTVSISWDIVGTSDVPEFVLSWVETGGPQVEKPVGRGFGSLVVGELIKTSLQADVGSTLDAGGLRWKLSCPLRHLDEDERPAETSAFTLPQPLAPYSSRVLLVEDEPLVAMELASAFERAGFAVLGPVSSVSKALALLDRSDCDAAVLDVNLGHETSEPIAHRLALLQIPFVVVSGYSIEQLPAAYCDAPLFTKPANTALLVDGIRQCLLEVELPKARALPPIGGDHRGGAYRSLPEAGVDVPLMLA